MKLKATFSVLAASLVAAACGGSSGSSEYEKANFESVEFDSLSAKSKIKVTGFSFSHSSELKRLSIHVKTDSPYETPLAYRVEAKFATRVGDKVIAAFDVRPDGSAYSLKATDLSTGFKVDDFQSSGNESEGRELIFPYTSKEVVKWDGGVGTVEELPAGIKLIPSSGLLNARVTVQPYEKNAKAASVAVYTMAPQVGAESRKCYLRYDKTLEYVVYRDNAPFAKADTIAKGLEKFNELIESGECYVDLSKIGSCSVESKQEGGKLLYFVAVDKEPLTQALDDYAVMKNAKESAKNVRLCY